MVCYRKVRETATGSRIPSISTRGASAPTRPKKCHYGTCTILPVERIKLPSRISRPVPISRYQRYRPRFRQTNSLSENSKSSPTFTQVST